MGLNMTAYERRKTFFSCMEQQFPNLEDSKINTAQFLQASREIVTLIEQLGKVFSPVIYDMNGNIEKINAVYENDIIKNKYLQDMMLNQKEMNELTAISALQWLRRALHFVLRFFQLIISSHRDKDKNTESLEKLLKMSYTETLLPYHGWMTQQLFRLLCRMCLSREQFFQILSFSQAGIDDIVIEDMDNFNINLKICIYTLIEFYDNHRLEIVDRV